MTIKGLDRLNRKLKRFPSAVEAQIRAAMEKGADEVVAMMKRLAPADSGALRDSINWRWGTTAPKGSLALASVEGGEKLAITIYAGNNEVFYAHFVEFGTKAHIAGGRLKGAQIPDIPASPFFFVSWRAMRKRTKSRISRAVGKAARQIAAG